MDKNSIFLYIKEEVGVELVGLAWAGLVGLRESVEVLSQK